MKAKDKKLRPPYSANPAEGYLIIKTRHRYGYNTQHIPASTITAMQETYSGTTLSLALNDDIFGVELSMPLECMKYFIHLAKQGLQIDLQDYCGGINNKRIVKNSPEHQKFSLKMHTVTPDELLKRQESVAKTFKDSATPAPKAKEASPQGLNRFPYLSAKERAMMKEKARIRLPYFKKT